MCTSWRISQNLGTISINRIKRGAAYSRTRVDFEIFLKIEDENNVFKAY